MPTLKTSQGEVFCESHGNGHPIVLLHADGASSVEYASVIQSLSERFQVIILDFPGCGRSPRRAFSHDYYIENAKAALQVVKSFTKEPIFTIGNGGGGVVGLWMAILMPSLVIGVVADSVVEFLELDDVQKDLRAHHEPSHEMISFWKEMNGEDWHTVIVQLDRVMAEKAEQKASLFDWRLEEIKCPVLLTGSRQDHLLSHLSRRALEAAEQLVTAKLILYPDGGHPSMWSQAPLFWRDALNFIETHTRS